MIKILAENRIRGERVEPIDTEHVNCSTSAIHKRVYKNHSHQNMNRIQVVLQVLPCLIMVLVLRAR